MQVFGFSSPWSIIDEWVFLNASRGVMKMEGTIVVRGSSVSCLNSGVELLEPVNTQSPYRRRNRQFFSRTKLNEDQIKPFAQNLNTAVNWHSNSPGSTRLTSGEFSHLPDQEDQLLKWTRTQIKAVSGRAPVDHPLKDQPPNSTWL